MIVTIDGIPVYDALITDDDCGMNRISLVDAPAVDADFLAFAKDKALQMYSVSDEEKRIVRGVIMRADYPIYRRDKRGEYYVIYKADTIRKMAEKYLLESKQNEVNLDHQDDTDVDGVQMVQWFIKDSENGINPAGFEEIADGSLFAEFHVINDEVWASIKEGTYKGFSLEGVFDMQPETNVSEVEEIVDVLDGIFSKLYKNDKMSKLARFKEALAKILVECGNVTTDRGILYWESDADLKEGDEVFVEDAEGNRTPAPDGDYTTSDGKVIVVVDGKVAEIKDAKAEVAPEEPESDDDNNNDGEGGDNTPADGEGGEGGEGGNDTPETPDTPDTPGNETPADPEQPEQPVEGADDDALEERIKALEDVVAMVCEYLGIVEFNKQEKLPTLMAAMQKEIDALKGKPMAKPAHEEVVASAQNKPTGIKGIDRLAQIMGAK